MNSDQIQVVYRLSDSSLYHSATIKRAKIERAIVGFQKGTKSHKSLNFGLELPLVSVTHNSLTCGFLSAER